MTEQLDEELENVITLIGEDENGNEIEVVVEIVDMFEVDGKTYALLAELDDNDEESEDAMIMRIDKDDETGEDVFSEIEDDDEFEKVRQVYEESFED